MELKDFEYNFIDAIYDYDGLWGRKSKCGLKVIKQANNHVIIVTDLYEENLGGTVTEYCGELAQVISKQYSLDIAMLCFIHHVPEVNSSLEFYEEAFYKVEFELKEDELTKPDWIKITRQEVLELSKP